MFSFGNSIWFLSSSRKHFFQSFGEYGEGITLAGIYCVTHRLFAAVPILSSKLTPGHRHFYLDGKYIYQVPHCGQRWGAQPPALSPINTAAVSAPYTDSSLCSVISLEEMHRIEKTFENKRQKTKDL